MTCLFIAKNAGLLDTPIEKSELERFSNDAYYEIFGVNPAVYWYPDTMISEHYRPVVEEVLKWGRSVHHSRTQNQATRAERDAIATFTGERVPATPAQAAGGKANKGGYFPNQPAGKCKGKGRSAPYPQAASSSSSAGPSWAGRHRCMSCRAPGQRGGGRWPGPVSGGVGRGRRGRTTPRSESRSD